MWVGGVDMSPAPVEEVVGCDSCREFRLDLVCFIIRCCFLSDAVAAVFQEFVVTCEDGQALFVGVGLRSRGCGLLADFEGELALLQCDDALLSCSDDGMICV